MLYLYDAYDAEKPFGERTVTGTIEADSVMDAFRLLRGEGLEPKGIIDEADNGVARLVCFDRKFKPRGNSSLKRLRQERMIAKLTGGA